MENKAKRFYEPPSIGNISKFERRGILASCCLAAPCGTDAQGGCTPGGVKGVIGTQATQSQGKPAVQTIQSTS